VRVGLFGGSFDPIHLGHCLVILTAVEELALDELLVLPTARPPHKPDRALTDVRHRLAMARVAVEGLPGVRVVEEEAGEGVAYTIDTLRWARRTYGDGASLFLLVGGDSLRDLDTWRDADGIRELATVVAHGRPGIDPAGPGEVRTLTGPAVALSSTEIRARAREGRSLRFRVPEPVARYIDDRGLYRDPSPC